MTNNMNLNKRMKPITRGTRKYVKQAIKETGSDNIFDICEHVSLTLEETFVGDTLEYQLREDRMDLATTGKIMDAIDTYMYNYLSKDDKKNIEEGQKRKEEVYRHIASEGIDLEKINLYRKADVELFNRYLRQAEKVYANLNSTQEDKDWVIENLDTAIAQLKKNSILHNRK